MLEEKKKISRMTDELLNYFLDRNAKDININVLEVENKYIITVFSEIKITEEEIEYINSNFVKHKNIEYECFLDLMGEGCSEDELELLFMVANEVRVYYENNIFKFIVEVNK